MIPIITERAASDILGIFDFRGEKSARLTVNEILQTITDLEIFPLLGRTRDELRKGTRSLVVRKYLIFYTIFQNTPVILRVVHGSRDLETLFENEP